MQFGKYLKVFIFLICLQYPNLEAQNPLSKIGESERFEFFSNYWFNLHHFLNQEALVKKTADKSILTEAETANMTASQKEILDQAIAYYSNNLLDQDLRMSDYMADFKAWITSSQNDQSFTDIPEKFEVHCKTLSKVSAVYSQIFWPNHKSANSTVLGNNLRHIKAIEEEVSDKLGNLTRERWQSRKIRVDVTAFAKATSRNLRDRPYTSLYPTHIVMNSKSSLAIPGNWLELLFHEASHHLIGSRSGFVGGTIEDVVASLKTETPRSLWHAYLFYMSGMVVKSAIQSRGFSDYELYMKRNRVFSNYIPLLDKHLQPYMWQKTTLAQATENIIKGLK